MNIEVSETIPRVVLLKFDTQYEITSTMMMLQEYYESPYDEIYRKPVIYEDYMDVYAKYNGNFTYFTDWSGFNVPANVAKKYFKAKYMDSHVWKKEQQLFYIFDEYYKKYKNKFYIIAVYKDGDINHELAHGLYYLYPEYKRGVDKLINLKNNYFIGKRKWLLEKGYREEFIMDELQAYFLEEKNVPQKLNKKHSKLVKLFDKYSSLDK